MITCIKCMFQIKQIRTCDLRFCRFCSTIFAMREKTIKCYSFKYILNNLSGRSWGLYAPKPTRFRARHMMDDSLRVWHHPKTESLQPWAGRALQTAPVAARANTRSGDDVPKWMRAQPGTLTQIYRLHLANRLQIQKKGKKNMSEREGFFPHLSCAQMRSFDHLITF